MNAVAQLRIASRRIKIAYSSVDWFEPLVFAGLILVTLAGLASVVLLVILS